jgi:hypothetical protein
VKYVEVSGVDLRIRRLAGVTFAEAARLFKDVPMTGRVSQTQRHRLKILSHVLILWNQDFTEGYSRDGLESASR